MDTRHPIAIVGGGPAGALAAATLAGNGERVLLFDEKLAWEKPCGGGITHKALQQYPFLGEVEADRAFLEHCELISPSGRRVRFHLRYPLAIFSRFALNGLLLERAAKAGAEIRQERVARIAGSPGDWRLMTSAREYDASYIVLAAGARNPFRGQFVGPFAAEDLMVTAGYFIPRQSSLVQIQFLQSVSGYIWVFPRQNHVSAGIVAKIGEITTAVLRTKLERWLQENGFSLKGARFYSHILPALRVQTLDRLETGGDGWAMVGDNAGLVDPVTGEGLYYALRSGELCAQSLLAGRACEYRKRIEDEIVPELRLAARVSDRFYNGQIWGESVLERLVAFTQQSEGFRELVRDLFAGIQGYRNLRSRFCRELPSMMAEGLTSTLRMPWSSSGFATHPFSD